MYTFKQIADKNLAIDSESDIHSVVWVGDQLGGYVLAKHDGRFATWAVSATDGSSYWGHYGLTLREGLLDLMERSFAIDTDNVAFQGDMYA